MRDPHHVVGAPAVVEVEGVDARDSVRRHVLHFLVGEAVPLVDDDRVEPRVVGAAPGRGVEVGRRLVVVVEDGRAVLDVGAGDCARQGERLADVVAVVVVRDVLAPVERSRRQVGVGVLALPHVQIDHLRPPVRLDHRRDHVDQVVADVADEIALAHREPVGQLHEHLGRPRLGGVDRACGPVGGLGGGRSVRQPARGW